MKTKKMSKKLTIKKVTITNLASEEMDKARGGITGFETICGPCSLISCGVTVCPAQCSLQLPCI